MQTIHPPDTVEFTHSTLSMAHIDTQDRTYAITTATELDRLTTSIRRVGLISPPIVKILGRSRYALVCGFGRVAACQRLGHTTIGVKVAPGGTKDIDYIGWAITDNLLQRSLNLIELARCYTLLARNCQNDRMLYDLAGEFGLDNNPKRIDKLLAVGRLPRFIQNGILSSTVALPVALELGTWNEHQAAALVEIFSELKMSLGKQREILSLVAEIAIREDVDIVAVIENASLRAILEDGNLDKNQKTRLIRGQLKERRFPELTAAQRRYDRWAKSLKLGSDIKLAAPDFFEAPDYRITFSFKNIEELRARWKIIDRTIHNPALSAMLENG